MNIHRWTHALICSVSGLILDPLNKRTTLGLSVRLSTSWSIGRSGLVPRSIGLLVFWFLGRLVDWSIGFSVSRFSVSRASLKLGLSFCLSLDRLSLGLSVSHSLGLLQIGLLIYWSSLA
jgi:hypothetical protein